MTDINHYKKLLEAEKIKLEAELQTVAHRSVTNPADWEASPANLGADSADENEVADEIEGFEENSGITRQLEIQINDVVAALDRIEQGTYGTCTVCQAPIEEARLNANPAATTCIAHL